MKWLKQSLSQGVSMLILLRLRNAPPQDAIAPTLEIWFRTLTYKRHWEQAQDQVRFEEAFIRLAQTCSEFPTPKQLLEAMPKIDYKALPEPSVSEAKREEMLAKIRAFAGEFRRKHNGK